MDVLLLNFAVLITTFCERTKTQFQSFYQIFLLCMIENMCLPSQPLWCLLHVQSNWIPRHWYNI